MAKKGRREEQNNEEIERLHQEVADEMLGLAGKWRDEQVDQLRREVATEMLVMARALENTIERRVTLGTALTAMGKRFQAGSKERRALQKLLRRLEAELDGGGATSSSSSRDVVRGMRAPGRSPGEAAGPRPIAGDSG